MMHPVGPLAPATYWRRRLAALVALVIVLYVFTKIVSAFGSSTDAAALTPASTATSRTVTTSLRPATKSPSAVTSPSPTHTSAAASSSPPSSAASTSASSAAPSSSSASSSSDSSAAPADTSSSAASTASADPALSAPTCSAGQVHVAALSPQTSYAVGDQPVLGLQATNTGGTDCTVTLSDSTVVLQVYNGEARVWGSDDCAKPTTPTKQLLPSGVPVTVQVPWAGTTSTPGCQGTRQPVSAGTYTLYATLGGRHGTATQFAFH